MQDRYIENTIRCLEARKANTQKNEMCMVSILEIDNCLHLIKEYYEFLQKKQEENVS